MKIYLRIIVSVIGIVILCFLFFRGKTRAMLDTREYVSWVEGDNSYLYCSKEIGDYTFKSKLLPSNYIILKDDPNFDFNKRENKPIISGYDKSIYFSFEIKSNSSNDPIHQNSSSAMVYNDLLKYFSFDIQNDFKLIQNGDTLDCKLYHFERSYNVTPFLRMNLVFERPHGFEENDFILTLNERKLGVGRLNFYYSANNLKEVPQLK